MREEDICFVTTSLYTKWLDYQSKIISKLFPASEHIIVDGRKNWPVSWFYWINLVKNSGKKYFIHLDEDFFIINRHEVLKSIETLENREIDLLGTSDGFTHYRAANPVAINSFYMVGRVSVLEKFNFENIKFHYTQNKGWINNYNLCFKDSYKLDWIYPYPEFSGSNFEIEAEPYYAFYWAMKEQGAKFGYLFPHFDERFKSTNPRISEESEDIGIHMWYLRQWQSDMDIFGLRNQERYNLVEKFIIENLQ